jgi:hypothetical protein
VEVASPTVVDLPSQGAASAKKYVALWTWSKNLWWIRSAKVFGAI